MACVEWIQQLWYYIGLIYIRTYVGINPLIYFNYRDRNVSLNGLHYHSLYFYPLLIVSRWREPQLQVGEKYLGLYKRLCKNWIKIYANNSNVMLISASKFIAWRRNKTADNGYPMLVHCWANVVAVNRHWDNVSGLLGHCCSGWWPRSRHYSVA